MRGPTYDKERISLNLARMKRGGNTFEVVVNPDEAVAMKQGEEIDIEDVLQAEHILFDAKKGELASETEVAKWFPDKTTLQIAEQIIREGDLQLTAEHREQLRAQKYNKIVNMIHMNAINPQTGIVHPEARIRRAMEEAKIRVEELQSPEEQLKEVVKKLQPILPLKFATFIATVHLPAEHAQRMYGVLTQYGTLENEQWGSDGGLSAQIELPAGRYNELVDELSSKTHGNVQIDKKEK